MLIRFYDQSDADAVASIHIASWQQTYRGLLPDHALDNILPDEFRSFWHEDVPQDSDIHLVAVEDGEIRGIMSVLRQDAPYVDRLHTHPLFRSRGIGQKLMARAAHQLLHEDYDKMWLYVAQANRRALAFYERLGGVVSAEKNNVHYGTSLPCFRIDWSDATALRNLADN